MFFFNSRFFSYKTPCTRSTYSTYSCLIGGRWLPTFFSLISLNNSREAVLYFLNICSNFLSFLFQTWLDSRNKLIILSISWSSSVSSVDIPEAFFSSQTFFLCFLFKIRYQSLSDFCVTRNTSWEHLVKFAAGLAQVLPLGATFIVRLRLAKYHFPQEIISLGSVHFMGWLLNKGNN